MVFVDDFVFEEIGNAIPAPKVDPVFGAGPVPAEYSVTPPSQIPSAPPLGDFKDFAPQPTLGQTLNLPFEPQGPLSPFPLPFQEQFPDIPVSRDLGNFLTGPLLDYQGFDIQSSVPDLPEAGLTPSDFQPQQQLFPYEAPSPGLFERITSPIGGALDFTVGPFVPDFAGPIASRAFDISDALTETTTGLAEQGIRNLLGSTPVGSVQLAGLDALRERELPSPQDFLPRVPTIPSLDPRDTARTTAGSILGPTTTESLIASRGDPIAFQEAQTEAFRERNPVEQLALQIVLDPTNLIAAGGGQQILDFYRAGGKFDDVIRALAKADVALDNAQAAVIAKPLGLTADVIKRASRGVRGAMDEVAEAEARLATRLGTGAPELGGMEPRPPGAPPVRQAFGETPLELIPGPTPGQKLTHALRDAPTLRTQTERARTQELGRRAQASRAISDRLEGEQGALSAMGQFRGELPTEDFAPVRPALQQTELDSLFNEIPNALTDQFDRIQATAALGKVLGGTLPTRSEINLLAKIYGKEFGDELLKKRSLWRKSYETFADLLGLPRAILTSLDASFPLRQGALNVSRAGWWKAWGPMFKAMANKRYALQANDLFHGGPETRLLASLGDEDAIRAVEAAQRRQHYGLDLIDLEGKGGLSTRAEEFQTRLADKLPIVSQSEQGFVTFGNKLRTDVFDGFARRVDDALSRGDMTPEQADDQLRAMADWINIATGRASLSKGAAQHDLLVAGNRLFFSPRLNIARLQALDRAQGVVTGRAISPSVSGGVGKKIPGGLFDRSPAVRQEIARDIASLVAMGTSALALVNLSGLGTVELDPRSPDFGKGRIGNTRFDPWAGFQQIARYAAQFVTGERKATTSGLVSPADRGSTAFNFFRSKLDPGVPAFVVDMWKGETFIGEDFTFDPKEQFQQRFLPLSVQDMYEAYQAEGWLGPLKASPALVGVGVTAFETTRDVQDEVAADLFPTGGEGGGPARYADLDAAQRRAVNEDPRAVESIGSLPEPDVSVRNQMDVAFANIETFKTSSANELAEKINAGLEGKDLREAIGDWKLAGYAASEALFTEEVRDELERIKPENKRDAFALEYLAVELPWEVVDGDLVYDFDAFEAARQEVLDRAKAAGVEEEFITGRGANSFRAEIENETIREALNQLDDDQDAIQESGYWDIADAVARRWSEQNGLGEMNATELRQAVQSRVAEGVAERNLGEATAEKVTRQVTDEVLKDYIDLVTETRRVFRLERLDITEKLMRWGYYGEDGSASAEVVAALDEWRASQ